MVAGVILPGWIKPLYYYLALQVYLDGYMDLPEEKVNTFKGTVRMLFQSLTDTNLFYMNVDGLEILSYKLYTPDNVTIPVNVEANDDMQTIEFKTGSLLKRYKYYLIELNYKGRMRGEGAEGLFAGTYSNGQSYAATKFEPAFARRMVPCVDQPDAKAIWKVTVIHPKMTRAVSNGERIRLIERNGWALTKFSDTPRMSSYLLAIFVSNFQHYAGRTESGTRVRLFAPNNTLHNYKEIFDYSLDRIEYYSRFLDEPPKFEKLDQIVVNLRSTAGMENFGLISYNARSMLGSNRLQTVAHEIVHQWIGNDATPKWWNDVWISEGLSTFLAEHLPFMGRVFQLYQSMRQLLAYEQTPDPNQGILLPLRTKITLNELKRGRNAVLNYNVYNRGAMFMAMLHATMGTEPFKKAVQAVVKSYRNNTITTDDFYLVFNNYAKATDKPKNFTRFCRSWVEQAGHPVLIVKSVDGGVEIKQDRNFNAERVDIKYRQSAPFNYKYDIPVFYTTNTNDGNLVWLYMDEEKIFIPVDNNDVISIDPFGEGMYKVHYDHEWYRNWARTCPQRKCQQDLFFKPCEEFLQQQNSYPQELRAAVFGTCASLDRGFSARHPNAISTN